MFLADLCGFHLIWILDAGWGGGWEGRGAPKGLVHNLLMQLFTLDSSKIEVSETYFFDIVTTQYDPPRYVKHVLGRIYVIFTLFGYWVGGAGRQQCHRPPKNPRVGTSCNDAERYGTRGGMSTLSVSQRQHLLR